MTNGRDTSKETVTKRVSYAIRQAILSIAIASVAAAIVGIVATEAVGAALTQSQPGWPTHYAALAVGLLAGYAAAATATIWALVMGLAEAIKAIAGDIERAGERVVHDLETLAGVQDRHIDTAGRRATVDGSVVTRDQPAVMSGVDLVAP